MGSEMCIRDSFRTPAPLQQQSMVSASRVGTLPYFFRAGRRLYRSWTVRQQCSCSTSTVDSFSLLTLAFVCLAYPAFVLRPRFPAEHRSLLVLVFFQVLFLSACTGPFMKPNVMVPLCDSFFFLALMWPPKAIKDVQQKCLSYGQKKHTPE